LIAAEKAGIIKNGGHVVLYPQEPQVDAVIDRVCREKSAKLHRLKISDVKRKTNSLDGQNFDFKEYKNLRLPLLSGYQCLNAATAIMATEVLCERGFNISEENIRAGLTAVRWPGRFEIMRRKPMFVVDSSHNAQGAAQLAANLHLYFPGKMITFIIGVSEDKDYIGVIKPTLPLAKRYIATEANSTRALSAKKLGGYLRNLHPEVIIITHPEEAAKRALEMCDKDEVICSFGSLFHVGAIRDFLSSTV